MDLYLLSGILMKIVCGSIAVKMIDRQWTRGIEREREREKGDRITKINCHSKELN